MQNTVFFRSAGHRFVQPVLLSALFFSLTVFSFRAAAKNSRHPADTTVEKKVDFLERIYFSGADKSGLMAKILVALEEINSRQPSPGLEKQRAFLLEMKERAGTIATACEVLDMFAVGIYELDAVEADRQGVRYPSPAAKANSVDIVSSLNKLSSSSTSLSSSASNLAWQNTVTSGKTTNLGAGATKVAGTSANIASGAATAGQALATTKQLKDVASGLFGNKKGDSKPCRDVPKKDIEIGYHPTLTQTAVAAVSTTTASAPAQNNTNTTTTVISIAKIPNSLLRELTDALRSKEGVTSAEKSFDAQLSTITVSHAGKTDALSDWIEDRFGKKLSLLNNSNGKITLAVK